MIFRVFDFFCFRSLSPVRVPARRRIAVLLPNQKSKQKTNKPTIAIRKTMHDKIEHLTTVRSTS